MLPFLYLYCFIFAGSEDAGFGGGDLRAALVPLPFPGGVQLLRECTVREPLVSGDVPDSRLPQQCHQPHPVQRHVGEVPTCVRSSLALCTTGTGSWTLLSVHADDTRPARARAAQTRHCY